MSKEAFSSIRVSDDVRKTLKHLAMSQDRPMCDVVGELINAAWRRERRVRLQAWGEQETAAEVEHVQ